MMVDGFALGGWWEEGFCLWYGDWFSVCVEMKRPLIECGNNDIGERGRFIL
jgi:hypothetical protein